MPAVLKINIIGAGIAGLAAAFALQRLGHECTVYERHDTLTEFGAGIQVPPNATRILYHHWQLHDAFSPWASMPRQSIISRYDGTMIGRSGSDEDEVQFLYGSPHVLLFRKDLQDILAKEATAIGVKIVFSKRFEKIDSETGTVWFKDGTSGTGDLLIAADGIGSRARNFISPANMGIQAQAYKEFCFRMIIPREVMLQDPLTAAVMKAERSDAWLAEGRWMLSYPIGKDSCLQNIAIVVTRPSDKEVGAWNEPGDINEMRAVISDFCPTVKAIGNIVDECSKWTLGYLPDLPDWSSASGKFVVVGDAAHAMTAHAAQGGGMAIEDAAVLAECLSTVTNPATDLKTALTHFETLRKPRCIRIKEMALGNADMLALPDGPQQQARDAMLKAKMEKEEQAKQSGKLERPVADRNAANSMTPEGRQWIYGSDVLKEAQEYLAAKA